MTEFREGRKVHQLVWPNDDTMTTGAEVVDMEIALEAGHMSRIPFVKITYTDGTVGMIDPASVLVILEEARNEQV